jgi:ERCC4-type nuclease
MMASGRPVVSVTKPDGRAAIKLADAGLEVLTVEGEWGVEWYVLSDRLAIERRTGDGFLQGIVDKSLFNSALYLQENYGLPVLIVEGQLDGDHRSFNPQAVLGALSSMVIRYGMSVLRTQDVEETVGLIAMMARQEQIGIPEISLVPKRKATELVDMQRRVVEMLPGCGMVAARELLQHFGSIRRLANSIPHELQAVRGIGRKRAREVHRVLNAEYRAVDTERNLEDAIEAAPELLFDRPVELIARQHHIYSQGGQRHVVDLIFRDPVAQEVILVELKRGEITPEHRGQVRRYLDHATESEMVRAALAEGSSLRGLLATIAPSHYKPPDPDIAVRVVGRQRTIDVLQALRDQRLAGRAEREEQVGGSRG